ncbi:flagellar basal body P-ring formation protein FlgA [Campylobacter sp. TTU-622]|uniref:flagellar basal body P-ring formation chaperone FlgA n=1 Tax=unclassified Campylobacter TaxID=2593542 RepID=UPI001905D4EA|nr:MULTISPECIES: flagellar basal body P-ring formation chaperone FlgA [unclassified Campylobacter]MBK1973321.1 flagellar basal body P-ring formation protein FlgA [Campylobacter sp. TTU-622]MBK1992254.1 flagellar basal body P-ring formation protein FlgA [Campylobacter sp. 2018MI34]
MKKILFFICIFNLCFANNIEKVKLALSKELQNNFSNIIITKIDIMNTSLPKDFDQYEFLRLANAKFNKAQGFLRAEFKTPQNIQKNIFFRYFVDADIEILKSKKSILKGEKLSPLDFDKALMDFDKIPLNALSAEEAKNLVVKVNINKNTILKRNMFKINALIKRNDPIIGILRDSNIDIQIELTALENANLGERIKAKNKEGKVMQGIVSGKNRILLQ